MKVNKNEILRFLVSNDKLEKLNAKINKFNPFKILKLQDHEIRHSNIIAWLFDANGNHNLDDRILKRFLSKIITKAENDNVKTDIDLYQFQKINFIDNKVFREKFNIDIIITSNKNKLVILIENKVYSGEHSNQLERYLKTIESQYPNFKIIPIYLSLEGIEASNKYYLNANYQDLLETIEFVLDNYNDRTSQDVIQLLQFYITIIKEKLMMDEELRKLCKEVYNENRDVIDLLYTVGHDIDIDGAGIEFIKGNNDVEKITNITNPKQFWFIHQDFKKSKNMNLWWGAGYPFSYWFDVYYGHLKIILEIGPFDNDEKRIEFLNLLEQKGIKIANRAKEIGRKYTRIYTNKIYINDWSDTDGISDIMTKLFDKKELRNIHDILVKAISEFSWNYQN